MDLKVGTYSLESVGSQRAVFFLEPDSFSDRNLHVRRAWFYKFLFLLHQNKIKQSAFGDWIKKWVNKWSWLLGDFPGGSDGKSICLQCGRPGFDPWVEKISWRRRWQPTPVFLPGRSHGQRSLAGNSPRGRKESDMTERLHFTSLGKKPAKFGKSGSYFSLTLAWLSYRIFLSCVCWVISNKLSVCGHPLQQPLIRDFSELPQPFLQICLITVYPASTLLMAFLSPPPWPLSSLRANSLFTVVNSAEASTQGWPA